VRPTGFEVKNGLRDGIRALKVKKGELIEKGSGMNGGSITFGIIPQITQKAQKRNSREDRKTFSSTPYRLTGKKRKIAGKTGRRFSATPYRLTGKRKK